MIKKGPRICVIKLLLKMDFCQKLLMKSFKNVSYFQKLVRPRKLLRASRILLFGSMGQILRPMIHTQIIEPIPKPSFPD